MLGSTTLYHFICDTNYGLGGKYSALTDVSISLWFGIITNLQFLFYILNKQSNGSQTDNEQLWDGRDDLSPHHLFSRL